MGIPSLLAFQRFDQEQQLGGGAVVHVRRVGEASVAAAGDDGLEGVDQRTKGGGQVRIGGELVEQGRCGSGVARAQRPGDREAEAAVAVVVLAAVAPIGQITIDRLLPSLTSIASAFL
jgi:hypothetical protein